MKLISTDDFNIGRYIVNPVRVRADEEIRGYLLLKNARKQRHDARIIFLIDYQQLSITLNNDKSSDYYDLPDMDPSEERGVEFLLPPQTRGFHQVSVLLITDPDVLSDNEIIGIVQRSSFREIRYDLWVGEKHLPDGIDYYKDNVVAEAARTRIANIDIISPVENEKNDPLQRLTLKPGEYNCIKLRLYNCGQECLKQSGMDRGNDGPIPLIISVFWDDKMDEYTDYVLAADEIDNLTLKLRIRAPILPGDHHLNAIVFTLPEFSQFNPNDLEYASYVQTLFSRRVDVEVIP
ncbi:MAG: hypothetical protein PHQ40_11070 [Anaerolineaceae bacterium]|nr:hypothetical protein [Anaerolineaceae bacterium]